MVGGPASGDSTPIRVRQYSSGSQSGTVSSSPSASAFLQDSFGDVDLIAAAIASESRVAAASIQSQSQSQSQSIRRDNHTPATPYANTPKRTQTETETSAETPNQTNLSPAEMHGTLHTPPTSATQIPIHPAHPTQSTNSLASVSVPSSRLLFDDFDSRNHTLRSLLFDEDGAPDPSHDGDGAFDPTHSDRIATMRASLIDVHASLVASARTIDTTSTGAVSPSPTLAAAAFSVECLPSIDSIVHDPQSLPADILARSHASDDARHDRTALQTVEPVSSLPPASELLMSTGVTVSLPISAIATNSTIDHTQAADDPLALFRFVTPPIRSPSATLPLRRATSAIEPTRTISAFRHDRSPVRDVPSPLKSVHMPRPQSFASLSLSSHVPTTTSGLGPFRSSGRRRSGTMTAAPSPRTNHKPQQRNGSTPYYNRDAYDDHAPLQPYHVDQLKSHLDAYVADCVASVKSQLDECVRQYIQRVSSHPTAHAAAAAAVAPTAGNLHSRSHTSGVWPTNQLSPRPASTAPANLSPPNQTTTPYTNTMPYPNLPICVPTTSLSSAALPPLSPPFVSHSPSGALAAKRFHPFALAPPAAPLQVTPPAVV